MLPKLIDKTQDKLGDEDGLVLGEVQYLSDSKELIIALQHPV